MQFQTEDVYAPVIVAGPKTAVDQAHAVAGEGEPVDVRSRQRLAFDAGKERDVTRLNGSRCFHQTVLAARWNTS